VDLVVVIDPSSVVSRPFFSRSFHCLERNEVTICVDICVPEGEVETGKISQRYMKPRQVPNSALASSKFSR